MADDGDYDRSSRPLAGVVLCCTSIPPESRTELAARAEEMGAIHKLDLTSDVTHLIVGVIDTPKYKYVAKERSDVKVLDVNWVEAVRGLWMSNEPIDVPALERRHRLPTFAGLRICLTGFDDPVERQRLQTSIVESGAEYHADLTKAVTHLLALKPQGEKYKYANLWGVKTVAVEWFEESLERGMVLEETLYNPIVPAPERGRNAWIRKTVSENSLGKRLREESLGAAAVELDLAGRRKLRRTASNKLGSQNSSIWNDIVGGGFGVKTGGQEGDAGTRLPGNRLLGSAQNPGKENRRPTSALDPIEEKRASALGVFHGQRMFVQGFDDRKTSIVKDHLLSHDASISSSLPELSQAGSSAPSSSYLVVPHNLPLSDLPDDDSYGSPYTVVTEWWVERCIFRKSLVDPRSDIGSRPFARFPIPAFKGLSVSSTGFSGIDLLHVYKIVRLMGASYEEVFSDGVSVLLCKSAVQGNNKVRHAVEWGIPAVKAEWLSDSIKSGAPRPYGPYLVADSGKVEIAIRQPSARETPDLSKPLTAERFKHAQETDGRRMIRHAASVSGPTLEEEANRVSLQARQARKAQAQHPEPEPLTADGHDERERSNGESADRAPSPQPSDGFSVPSRPHPAPNTAAITKPAVQHSSLSRPQAEPEDLTSTIASLLARKQSKPSTAPRTASLPDPSSTTTTTTTRRNPPTRLLGRAPSAGSVAHCHSRAGSADPVSLAHTPHAHDSIDLDPALVMGLQMQSDGTGILPEPSQKVTYDDHEALEVRERLLRKMGGGCGRDDGATDGKGRVQGIGVARDLGVKARLRGTR